MTEQEAQVLVERLRRVWNFERGVKPALDGPRFWLEIPLNESVVLTYSWHCVAERSGVTLVEVPDNQENQESGRLFWRSSDPGIMGIGLVYGDREKELFQPFARKWMEFFRRGCFLMGLPIEASDHEKAE